MSAVRLAVVVSHPIQHFVHLFRALGARPGIALRVFFCARIGVDPYRDREMNTAIAWQGNLLGGYDHAFLPEAEHIAGTGFRALDNPSLGGALAQFKPDAVLVFGYAQRSMLRALWWCRTQKVPVLMTGDGDAVSRRSWPKAALRAAVLRRLFAQVAAFLTPGDGNETMLARLGVPSERLFRTPFPIDEPAYAAAGNARTAHRHALRNALGIAPETPIALCVGKLSPRKRPADLVEAWRRLPSGLPTHLVFCGDGAERPALEALIRHHRAPAHLAGFVNLDRLPAFYAGADILIHPADFDPHPLALSEAAACGLPLLVSDRVGALGPTGVAREGGNALVHPAGDTAALARNWESLLRSPALRARMGAASLGVAAERSLAHSVAGVEGALAFALR